MSRYVVRKSPCAVALTADPACEPWPGVAPLPIAEFSWYESGRKQATTAHLCYDDDAIHVLFECEDRHIFARHTKPNSNVCRDSCVEFFASVAERPGEYFNFEVNCCGTVLLAHGPDRHGRTYASPELISRFGVRSTVPGRTKKESPDDDGWVMQIALPWDALSDLVGAPVRAESGTTWRANFYRCGGKTDVQYASWAPITHWKPDFHRPEFFGELVFE